MKSTLGRARNWAAANPTLVLGSLALLLYVELRVPTEIFYRHLGVTADDAGFGGIEVALIQSVQLLVVYGLLALAGALVYVILGYPLAVTVRAAKKSGLLGQQFPRIFVAVAMPLGALGAILLTVLSGCLAWLLLAAALVTLSFAFPEKFFPGLSSWELRAARRRAGKAAPAAALFSLVIAAVVLPAFLIVKAGPEADDVKGGEGSDSIVFPWNSRKVTARWTVADPPFALTGCAALLYLGEDGSRVLLYDSDADRALRVNAGEVELAFPEECNDATSPAAQPPGKGTPRRGKGGQNS